MQLPDDVKAIRARYVAAFPVPTGEPGPEHEERVRQWTIRFAEQVAHDLPGQGYGVKRADGGRPIGKDSLARRVGDRIDGWDLLIGAGDGTPEIADNPAYHDISDQVFVPVTPTNHLGTPEPEPEPKPEPQPVDLSALLAQLQRMNDQLDAAARASTDAKVAAQLALDVARETQAAAAATLTVVQDVATRPDPPQPIAWAGALGLRVRLTPEYPK